LYSHSINLIIFGILFICFDIHTYMLIHVMSGYRDTYQKFHINEEWLVYVYITVCIPS
jgi:hypothetical protein